MTQRDEVSLREMLDHAREAQQLAAGRTRAELDSDRVFQLALTRLLEILGEAASRVSPECRAQNPQVVWPQIVGLRNRLIHGYDQVDYDVVWAIMEHDVAPLIEQVRAIVGEAGPS